MAVSRTKHKPLASLSEDGSYAFTMSADGKTEAAVLMHSRKGIRIEYNIHKAELSLWLSPQAGKELSCRYRNFSCRDDHTSIFERISFPELRGRPFKSCAYDPFHSILRFDGQALHIASLLDKPVVLVWTDRPEIVDFRADKQDSILERDARLFVMRHPDRGLSLDFAAALGTGKGGFIHQPETDTGRSTYARAELASRQLLVIAGELSRERVARLASTVASGELSDILARNERNVARETKPGSIALKGLPIVQKLYDMNKRHLLSVQDESGAVRAALKYVYYLIWSTDGSVTATSMSQAGWQDFLKRWMEFLLANPTEQNAPPKGRFYGQLVNPRISKREEFGALCAVWPAFMYWGMSGDDRFVKGAHLTLLKDIVDWLERYCWDRKVGALGTFYIGGGSEDPFAGSNDFGWDAAVGCPIARNAYAPHHEGKLIKRVYEFGMNLDLYNIYLMLSSVSAGAESKRYLTKAASVERFLEQLLSKKLRAYYLVEGRGMVAVGSRTEGKERGLLAVQSQSAAFYMPRFAELFMNRMRAFQPYTEESVRGKMPCSAYGHLAGLDTEFVDDRAVAQSLMAGIGYHVQPSTYLPMPWTMVEVMGAKDGEYHDIRPQAFSAGPFQAAVMNLAVRTMPFGVGVRACRYVKNVTHFEYRDGYLDIDYAGTGSVRAVTVNGSPVPHSLQIPDTLLKRGANKISVAQEKTPAVGPVLVYSTVRLLRIALDSKAVSYRVRGYAQNVLILRDAPAGVRVRDERGSAVAFSRRTDGRYTFIEFKGAQEYEVKVIF